MSQSYRYAGFWIRVAATLLDNLLFLTMFTPIVLVFAPTDYFTAEDSSFTLFDGIEQLIYAFVTIGFWLQCSATPGKLLLNLQILDADTGRPITLRQAIIRYIGYFMSGLIFSLGYFWAAFDPRKQCWHDKMANTVVVQVYDET